jgi:predicted DCC family thiol-disulfide oxidoreductase YuxK
VAEHIFYDGDCGLCHGFVKFVLPRDRGQVFRFAPLESDAFRHAVPAADRARLPDSVIVITNDAHVLSRSDAVLHVMRTLGGFWGVLAALARVVPRSVRDRVYDRVAASRRRWFAPPADVCPVMPPELRQRFDL